MTLIFDVSEPCGASAGSLAAAGVQTVFRYYSRNTVGDKRLTLAEAKQLTAAGLRLGIVHEARHGDQIGSFSKLLGGLDASYCINYAKTVIGQPERSAIYFGVDVDASQAEIDDSILPYFTEVMATMRTDPGGWQVGVYGSGLVCQAVLDKELADLAWLAQSTGWAGYHAFLDSGRWTLKQHLGSTVGGVSGDANDAGQSASDIGDFVLAQPSDGSTLNFAALKHVNARSGLRLRLGPGLEYDSESLLPNATSVYVLKDVGDWSQVDLQGDGIADGFVNKNFLV